MIHGRSCSYKTSEMFRPYILMVCFQRLNGFMIAGATNVCSMLAHISSQRDVKLYPGTVVVNFHSVTLPSNWFVANGWMVLIRARNWYRAVWVGPDLLSAETP